MATAIITGSARGIGAAIALRLAKDGYDIALNDIAESCFENNDIIDKIKAEGVKCEKYIADVSKYDQCEAFVKSVKADFGSIDVLVNNAGITRDGLLVRMSEENYDLVVAVNQTKAAIIGMTKTTAKELGPRNITCNAVAPGFIHTAMTDALSEELRAAMVKQIAMGRCGEVEEIAGVVSFLASKDASYVTGHVIDISGCLSM